MQVLGALLSEYEASSHGPGKWQKLATFLHQRLILEFILHLICGLFFNQCALTCTMEICSLEGPVLDLIKRLIDQVGSEKNSLALKCRSIEDQLNLLKKQLEASEKYKSDYLKRYEDAINDKKKVADDYMNRITNLQGDCSSLDERCSSLKKTVEQAKQESLDWKRKYESVLSKLKAEEDQANSDIAILKSRSSAAEARLAAAREQSQSAQEEAEEWKRKFEIALRDTKAALEKAALAEERTNKQTRLREDDLRKEFSNILSVKVNLHHQPYSHHLVAYFISAIKYLNCYNEKYLFCLFVFPMMQEDELKDKATKIKQVEEHLTTLGLELKVNFLDF